MARLAAERPKWPLADLGALLGPTPGRVAFALKIAVICAITTFVVEYYETPDAALSAYIVFFLNRPDRTTSIILSVAIMVLITLLIALLVGLAILVLDSPGWRVVAITLVSQAFLFLGSASKLKPVGSLLAMIVAYGL